MLRRVFDVERRVATARDVLVSRQRDIEFETEPELAAEIAALGLWREIGTINDQLSRKLVTADTRSSLPMECARAELIEYHGNIGVRIWYEGHRRLLTTRRHLEALLHPSLSFNDDGTIRQLVIFPITVARIAQLEDTRLVIVPSWAVDLPLADRQRATAYYLDFATPEQWARFPAQVIHYCRLTENQTIPFFTTHDLADHLAGFFAVSWRPLVGIARKIRVCLDRLFADCPAPPVQALILPFMAGYLLDSLSQPVHGDEERIAIAIDQVLETIEARAIPTQDAGVLRRFPLCYVNVVESVYDKSLPTTRLRDEVQGLLRTLVAEVEQHLERPLTAPLITADVDPAVADVRGRP
jgi:hypothetical protein